MPMSNLLYIIFVFASLALAGMIKSGPFKDHFRGNNIDISIAEENEEIKLTCAYPKRRAQHVHTYTKNFFGFSDLADMRAVEIYNYQTPDSSMSFYIKSKDGYFKIIMKKSTDNRPAQDKIREAAEGLKQVL